MSSLTATIPHPAKAAATESPIHELLSKRWSPCSFAGTPVAEQELNSLFEAARWAASSYNEQPWTYFVATKAEPAEFEKLLSCLLPDNQAWTKAAPVLVLGVVNLNFSQQSGKENRAAVHDLGLASANLVVEATSRGLFVHQMIGIVPERAREIYRIPPGCEAWTAMAIGHKLDFGASTPALQERDLAPRTRKPRGQFVFKGLWGQSAAGGSPKAPEPVTLAA